MKEKTYQKLSKPFALLVIVGLLKNVFFMIVLVPVALKSEKQQQQQKTASILLYQLVLAREKK